MRLWGKTKYGIDFGMTADITQEIFLTGMPIAELSSTASDIIHTSTHLM